MARAGSEQITSRAIALNDFTYAPGHGSAPVTVKGSELLEKFQQLADANGWPLSDLLSNCEIRAGQALQCRIVTKLPDWCDWAPDQSGYLMARMRDSPVLVGSSFVGDADASSDFTTRSRAKRCAPSSPLASEGRASRRARQQPAWLQERALSSALAARVQRWQAVLIARSRS